MLRTRLQKTPTTEANKRHALSTTKGIQETPTNQRFRNRFALIDTEHKNNLNKSPFLPMSLSTLNDEEPLDKSNFNETIANRFQKLNKTHSNELLLY